MRFKNGPQLPGAGRTRAGHHHGSHTPTSAGTISLGKMAYHTKQIRGSVYNLGKSPGLNYHEFSGRSYAVRITQDQ